MDVHVMEKIPHSSCHILALFGISCCWIFSFTFTQLPQPKMEGFGCNLDVGDVGSEIIEDQCNDQYSEI